MKKTFLSVLTTAVVLCFIPALRADDAEEKVKAQKKAAEANWALLDEGELAHVETPHFLIYGPKAAEKKLKDLGPSLEKAHETAVKAIKVDLEKDNWWPGKLTVYVLPERSVFTNFVRRVEKRRLEDGEFGSILPDGDAPHVAGAPGKAAGDPSAEVQVLQQTAAAMLQRKAGTKVPLPGWMLDGFGRATLYRVQTTTAATDRALVKKTVGMGKTTKDIWNGTLTGPESLAMQASMAEYLAYGPGVKQFENLLSNFRPDEGQDRKETMQAFASAMIKPDELEKAWWAWARQR